MNNIDMSHDTLCKLLQQGEETFNDYTSRVVSDFIESCPEESRQGLKQLQWKVDGLKYKYKDPMMRLIKVNELMFDSLNELNVELHKLKSMEG